MNPPAPYVKLRMYKVDVQNKILHSLREASHVGKKSDFFLIISSPPPPGPFRTLIFQKKVFGGEISSN